MPPISLDMTPIAWPLAIAIAWTAGEFAHRWIGLSRISMYALVGFLLAPTQTGCLPPLQSTTMLLLVNIAFGLILFELGYRINFRWLSTNPWIGASSFLESAATFGAIYFIGYWFNLSPIYALLLATLMMPTSPAAIMHIVNEQHSSGQVTERIVHLSAFNCIMAVLIFRAILGFLSFDHSGKLGQAIWESVVVLVASTTLGVIFGMAVPTLLKKLGEDGNWDSTIAFAIAVILLVVITSTLQLSPLLATLMFGFSTRHRRMVFKPVRKNFGALGKLLTVLLFVFSSSTLDWEAVRSGALLGLLLIGTRFLTKAIGVSLFAKFSGITWQKGALTGIALMPASVLAPLLLLQAAKFNGALTQLTEESAFLYTSLYAPVSAAILLLSIFGPILTQYALVKAGETHNKKES